MKHVAIGLIGTVLDRAAAHKRWAKWRPTVALCRQPELTIDRLELLITPPFASLAEQLSADIAEVSPQTSVRIHTLTLADPWDFEGVYAALYDFARGYPFDLEQESYLVHITTGTHVAQICAFLLTESRAFPAKLVQSSPRRDGRTSPIGSVQVIDLDLSKYDQLAMRVEQAQRDDVAFLKGGIETRNANFNALITEIERVATRSKQPILLMGPTGAGKSRLARRIFELKRARHQVQGELVEVNCATLRGDTAMSTLFGHRKGAFTGATSDRSGVLRAANGGVLFLDEVGELGLDEQAMLLRAIEEKRFMPVGADRDVQCEFQLIGGTNRDLHAAVRQGTFREDLWARLNLWTFRLPGLRARLEDIGPNLSYELQRFAEQTGRHVAFNTEARARFLRLATASSARWRGNFRDLNGAVIRMASLAVGGRITESDVDAEWRRLQSNWEAAPGHNDTRLLRDLLGEQRLAELDRFDRVQLADVVRVCRDSPSLSAAGRELFAASREQKRRANDADRLRKYLQRFGLSFADLWDRLLAGALLARGQLGVCLAQIGRVGA